MNKLSDKEKQYNSLLNYKESTRKSNNFVIIFTFFIFLILLLSAVLIFLIKKTDISFTQIGQMLDVKIKTLHNTNAIAEQRRSGFKLFNKRQNILLLGVDSNGADTDPFIGTRTDTIIILSVDPQSKTINAVSVPRDCKVYIADNKGIQKINAAHALGGPELTVKTLEETLGVDIDRYVLLDIDGVKGLVDALGGVDVYVEKDLKYNDNAGKLHINLKKGMQHLDGGTAEQYLRFRHDAIGDIGRTARQQWFLRGLLRKLQTPEAIPKIPELLNLAGKYAKTNLTLYDMAQLAALMRNVDISQIEVATLPGAPSKKGRVSYWILDPKQTQEVLDRMIYRINANPEYKPMTAGIVYTPDKEEEAMRIKARLEEAGYNVNCTGSVKLPHSQIIGHDPAVSSDFIKWLKRKVPELKDAQFVYDPIKVYCVDSDFTIIIADD